MKAEAQNPAAPVAAVPGGVTGRLRARNQDRQDCMALEGNRSCRYDNLTYRDLLRIADEASAGLLDLGVTAGDRIGLVTENCDLWLISRSSWTPPRPSASDG